MDREECRRQKLIQALTYLAKVKTVFKDEMEKYEQFKQIMKDFNANRVGTDGVILAASELFTGHDDLILGLNDFLPRGYEIHFPLIDGELSEEDLEIEDPTKFKNKVKACFEENSHIYESFLNIIEKLEARNKSISEAREEIAALFEGHIDLLHELDHFLQMVQDQHLPKCVITIHQGVP